MATHSVRTWPWMYCWKNGDIKWVITGSSEVRRTSEALQYYLTCTLCYDGLVNREDHGTTDLFNKKKKALKNYSTPANNKNFHQVEQKITNENASPLWAKTNWKTRISVGSESWDLGLHILCLGGQICRWTPEIMVNKGKSVCMDISKEGFSYLFFTGIFLGA